MLQVHVTLHEFDIEESDYSCTWDSLSFYSVSRLRRFCGNLTSTDTKLISSSSSLFIQFKTDEDVDEGRFSLDWKFYPKG